MNQWARHWENPDQNMREMVEALRKAGRQVIQRKTDIDLIVGYDRVTYLLEVKNGKNAPMTKTQEGLLLNWKGGPLYVVRSIEEALDLTSGVLLK